MAMVKNNKLGLSLAKVPVLKPLLAFALGILLGDGVRLPSSLVGLVMLYGVALLLLIGFRKRKLVWGRTLISTAFYSLWILLGMYMVVRTAPLYQSLHFSHFKSDSFLLVVDDEPQVKEQTVRFPVSVHTRVENGKPQRVSGKVIMTVRRDSTAGQAIRYGDLLHIRNTVQMVSPPVNPHEFDYRRYLENRDIWHQCFLSPDQINKLGTGYGNPILAKTLSFREQMMYKFAIYIKDNQALQLAVALIFGYRSQIDEHTVNVFTNTGTVHILSVSGLHVGLVFGLLTLLLKWMNRFPYGRYLRSILILCAIWFYVLLTGMSPPILRAGIMITFFILSMALDRQQMPLNTLFASALFILLFSPKSLFDIGFQLSYLAVLGMLLLYPLFQSLCTPSSRWIRILVEYTYISIAAQLFTLPVILYYFGQFPTYFIPANLFIALPSTGIMHLGILLAACPFETINTYVGVVLQTLLQFSVSGLEHIERLPKAALVGIVWNEIQVVLAFLILLMVLWAWNFRNKKAIFTALIFFLSFSVMTNVQHFRRREYSGYRIYNVRSELAIAQIKKGKVILYSTFDSLTHKGARFAIIPDLQRYVDMDNIEHIKLPKENRHNSILSLGKQKVLILESDLRDTLQPVDLIVWRKNNKNTLEYIMHRVRPGLVLVDGSNSEKTLLRIQDNKDRHQTQIYILKNNFAYVWNEK